MIVANFQKTSNNFIHTSIIIPSTIVISYFDLLSSIQAFGSINFIFPTENLFCEFLLPISDFNFIDYVLFVRGKHEFTIEETYLYFSVFGKVLDV